MTEGAVTIVMMAMFGCVVLGAMLGFLGGRRFAGTELVASHSLVDALERQVVGLKQLAETQGEADEAEVASHAARDELIVTYERALAQANDTVDALAAQRSKFAREAGYTVVS